MMNQYRLKALEGLLDYLSGVQGGDLKSLMDEPESPMPMDPMASPDKDIMEDGMGEDPKGIAIEKVSVMGKPGGVDDALPEDPNEIQAKGDMGASDDELDELYKKFRR